jgi:hypothetical protein
MAMTAAVDRFTAISGSCRIENLLINKLIHNTEKSTRYFLPGAFFSGAFYSLIAHTCDLTTVVGGDARKTRGRVLHFIHFIKENASLFTPVL